MQICFLWIKKHVNFLFMFEAFKSSVDFLIMPTSHESVGLPLTDDLMQPSSFIAHSNIIIKCMELE